jgi:hypothetical protein
MEEKFDVTIRGTAPLLMHRFDDGQDTHQVKKSGKQYDKKVDAKNALYKDEKGKIVHPSVHIESAMIKAAVNYRIPGQGKKTYKDAFKGGVFCEPRLIPHKISKWKIDLQNVVIQRNRVIRARPRFDEWELEFQILNIDERITSNIIKDILTDAGKFCGISDFRPRYGRFEVIKFESVKKAPRNKS